MAAVATIAGLMSKVRPEDDPCLPLKLRFDEEALICLPWSLSGFMAKHMEHPGSLHSKPALTKILSSHSASAYFLTRSEPGTTKALTPAATWRPWAILAASLRSLMRPLVQLPIKQTSIFVPWMGCPGYKSM